MAIYLVRHGESVGNLNSFFVGRTDYPLTDHGIQQARQLGQWFSTQGISFNTMYCSPLIRARHTAELIAATQAEQTLIIDQRMQEFDCGLLEGLGPEEAKQQYPDLFNRPLEEWGDLSPYGGESYDRVMNRVVEFCRELEQHYDPDQEILVVAHGGTLLFALVYWCALPHPRLIGVRTPNCCTIKLGLRGWRGRTLGQIEWLLPLKMLPAPNTT